MRIAVDIDSTLHHYWDVLSEAALRRFGIELPYDEQFTWGITRLKPEQLDVCIAETHCRQAILASRPYPAAVESVNRWKEAGHEVHVMSARAAGTHADTAEWLSDIGLRHDGLHCLMEKVDHCRTLGVGLLIDDSPENLRRAIEAGISVATILHPWNEDVVEEEDVAAARDWTALAALLEDRLGLLRPAAA